MLQLALTFGKWFRLTSSPCIKSGSDVAGGKVGYNVSATLS